jgi:hypothetical protein
MLSPPGIQTPGTLYANSLTTGEFRKKLIRDKSQMRKEQ